MGVPFSRFLRDQHIIRHPQNPQSPLVSVIMPTYKLRPGGLNQRAIESVLCQSFSDFEFLIIDDGSVDGLQDVLLGYQRQDPRIVIVRHEVNSGLPAVRVNEGLLLAKGKYIAYQFEDDEWRPDCLERLLATLHEGVDECVVYGAVEWIIYRPDGSIERRTLGEWDFNYALLRNSNKIAHCAVLHPKAVLDLCGLYDPHILVRRLCDYDLWLRMARFLPFRRCPHIIGTVTAGTKDALGTVVSQDLLMAVRHIATDRNARLTPRAIGDCEVDALPGVIDLFEANRLREHYLIPFWAQHPAVLTPAERKLILTGRASANRLCVTKADYSTSIDVTLGNFSRVLHQDTQSFAYVQENDLAVATRWNYDTLVLYRTIGRPSLSALREARAQGKSVIYLMDDNMFKFGTGYLADEFAYLKPGTPGYHLLEEEVAAADLVISYMPQITADCLERNPRVVELRTNIREEYILPAKPPEGGKASGRRLRYAILSGGARRKELETLWEEFYVFTQRHGADIEFHVWGVDPTEFGGPLRCPTVHRSFNHCYDAYLQALAEAQFDFVICPLFDDHDTKISKSPIKYLEATVAGAVGIYSDATAYQAVTHGVTGLKVSHKPQAWLDALESSFAMEDAERRRLHQAAKRHILEEFTTESQVLEYLTAFEAADLHAALASHSSQEGRAAIAYFFHESLLGGATLHLLQHARMLQQYRFRPILCFRRNQALESAVQEFAERYGWPIAQLDFLPTIWRRDPTEDDRVRARKLATWLREHDVRLVHNVTYMADVALAAQEAGLPLVATLHQYYAPPSSSAPAFAQARQAPPASSQDQAIKATAASQNHVARTLVSAVHSSSLRFAWQWQKELRAPAFCIRAPIARAYFESFRTRRDRLLSSPPTLIISGTLQPRKGQLRAIQAVKALEDQGIQVNLVLLGYDQPVPGYVAECRQAIKAFNLGKRVVIAGFVQNPQSFYAAADYLLCASDEESMPQSILQAMASGIRVITTPVGGIRELVVDGFSGVVADGTEVDALVAAIKRALAISEHHWQRMVENAHLTAQMVCTEEVVAYQLLKLYNVACREHVSITTAEAAALRRVLAHRKAALDTGRDPFAETQTQPIHRIPDNVDAYTEITEGGVSYRITPSCDYWCGLHVFVRLSYQRTVNSRLVLSVYCDQGDLLRKTTYDLSLVDGDRQVPLTFAPIRHSAGHDFVVTFQVRHHDPTTRVLLAALPPKRNLFRSTFPRTRRTVRDGAELACELRYQKEK